jgi:GntR family transcriptional regulator / MocR family aminotransferase
MVEDWANLLEGVDLHLDLQLDLDRAAGGRRDRLERALREAIRSGRLGPDTRLPASRTLATELGVARNTVGAAYDQLIAEGFLRARVGSGTYVVGMPQPRRRKSARPVESDGQSSVTSRLQTARSGSISARPRHDLRPGSPDVTTFPTPAWLRASRRALLSANSSVFNYGDPRGRVELRTALAEYLGRARGVLASPDQIMITSGYVQALSLLTRVLVDASSASRPTAPAVFAMENPGLPYHRSVVLRQGAQVVPVPVDERGAMTDEMESNAALWRAAAMVLTPAHQYPTGVTLHPSRRQAAVRWAQARQRLIIEDDYDGEFRYDRQPVGALQGMAPDHVVYVGTASKTLGPALRLAWAVLPERLMEPMIEAKLHADSITESLGQLTLADLITSHEYDRHVRACRLRYRRRRDLLVERLGREHELHGIAAGLHAMIELRGDWPIEPDVLERAAARGLAVGGLAPHWHGFGSIRYQGLIVGYGTPGANAYTAAIDVLGRVLRGSRK